MADPDFFAEERALTNPPVQLDQSLSGDFSQGLPPTGYAKPQAEPRPTYHSAILPLSVDSANNMYFDPWNAGPIGSFKQAVTLPGRTYSGEVQMPATFDPAAKDPRAD